MSKVTTDYLLLINKIEPMDEKEKKDKELILDWLESGESIYREENPQAHLCAYFPVVNLQKTQMFLVHHRKSGLWLPNGGHVDKGESLEETVIRELKEELDISWKKALKPFFVSRITTKGKDAGHIHNDIWFLVEIDERTSLNSDKREFHDWGWFGLNQAAFKSSEPNIIRAIKKIKQF
ncbi:NUDIX domain-containing protein [Candidatus Microgenomates bacterium]|nr:NUDIX domain-containing protein [Candidatus Microgenomates bacterium]